MTAEITIVYGVLLGALLLFASDRLRLDLVALLVLLVLALTGILTPAEALAGFADPVVLMIAGLFVVGEGLFQTGVAGALGRLPARIAGNSEVGLLAVIMGMVAFLSGFMSSTGTVAVMLPVVVTLAAERGIPPSRLLIPLSVASLLGGMLTLIGTPPNIVVSQQLEAMGREPFGFFTYTPVGLVMVVLGGLFMVLVGRRMLPDRASPRKGTAPDAPSLSELAGSYGLGGELYKSRIPEGSELDGVTVGEARIRSRFGVTVLDVLGTVSRKDEEGVAPDTMLRAGSTVVLTGNEDAMGEMARHLELQIGPAGAQDLSGRVGLVEVLLTPRSRLVDQTLPESQFREKYQVDVLSVRRLGEPVAEDLRDLRLRFGDTLLVRGTWEGLRLLQGERRDFVVTGLPKEMEAATRPYSRAPLAVGVMVGMMLLLTFQVVPAVHAVLLAAVAMVLGGAVSGDDAYRAVNWESVVLIAGILPLATAMEKTGAMGLAVDLLTGPLTGAGPFVLLAGLFVLTSALSQIISNTATAVLLAPIAFQLALSMDANPEPFLMGIAVAASTAFATPIASPVNTLVLGPGGYRFGDFFRVGVSLQLIILAASLFMVPLLFPFFD